jgi:5-methylcytosine-specific restriction endonuclease McrA
MQSIAPAVLYRPARAFRVLRLREDVATDARPPAPEPEAASHWASVHDALSSLGKQRAAHERDVCRWLLAAQRLAVHARAGYASLGEYAERIVGLVPRQTEERLRVGRALAALPLLDAALASGALGWCAIREITRVATTQTEAAWLAWAKPRRMRQIEKAVATRQPGDRPETRPDPSRLGHRLRFEVRAETMALFRELQSRVRADLGTEVDDDTLLYEIARRALDGPTDDGRAPYQIAVTRCDACGVAGIDAAGSSHEIDAVVDEMAECDAQLLPSRINPTNDDGAHPHVGAARRATQTVPPATRRAVMRRDHRRCVVPGCHNHRFLDVHHLDARAEGGGHDPDNLAVLCGSHHRAVHAGTLHIRGKAGARLGFHHADGSAYGAPPNLAAADVARQVAGMLEHMGFKPTRARALLDAALSRVRPDDVAVVLRAALAAS